MDAKVSLSMALLLAALLLAAAMVGTRGPDLPEDPPGQGAAQTATRAGAAEPRDAAGVAFGAGVAGALAAAPRPTEGRGSGAEHARPRREAHGSPADDRYRVTRSEKSGEALLVHDRERGITHTVYAVELSFLGIDTTPTVVRIPDGPRSRDVLLP